MFAQRERERERERETLILCCLKFINKIHFALNHYNYAHWLIIHAGDLWKLEYTCSDIYKEFCNGDFDISKSENPFSVAIDQALEQNNVVIKGVGGAVGLLSQYRDAALRRLQIAGPEVVGLLNEYEKISSYWS